MEQIKILALSGSLRKVSYNTALIKALIELSPSNISIALFEELGNLPLFNPDIEDDGSKSVNRLKRQLADSNGLIIASPEYAHGISGVLKNALDWLVSGEEFVNMPVMLFNTSPRATHAQESLREVIKTMSGKVIEESCLSIPLLGSNLDAKGIVQTTELSSLLKNSLGLFCSEITSVKEKYSV